MLVQHKLIESHGLYQHTARAIWEMYQVEVSLQNTVLTWSTMNGDIGIIEHCGLTVLHKGEVITVDNNRGTVRQFHMPVTSLHIHDIYIVTLFVEERVKSLSRAQCHIVL